MDLMIIPEVFTLFNMKCSDVHQKVKQMYFDHNLGQMDMNLFCWNNVYVVTFNNIPIPYVGV